MIIVFHLVTTPYYCELVYFAKGWHSWFLLEQVCTRPEFPGSIVLWGKRLLSDATLLLDNVQTPSGTDARRNACVSLCLRCISATYSICGVPSSTFSKYHIANIKLRSKHTLKLDFVGSRRLSGSPPYFSLFLCVLGHKERRAYSST